MSREELNPLHAKALYSSLIFSPTVPLLSFGHKAFFL